MPVQQKYFVDFNEEGIYHVYNRTNNKEKLFLSDENRYFFLTKYKQYLSPILDTYSWCLLPNHFHFLIKIKSLTKLLANFQNMNRRYLTSTEKKFLAGQIDTSVLAEQTFKRFFQSYSLSFNKYTKRKGNLFYRPFKRLEIIKDSHFTQAMVYIHANPMKHKIVKDFTTYRWSSWQHLINDKYSSPLKKEIMKWFGNKQRFIQTHMEMSEYYYQSNISIED